MALPRLYPPGSFQVTLNLLQGTQVAAVVLGLKGAGGFITQPELVAIRDLAWNAFRPLISNSTTCTGATARNTSAASGPVIEAGAPATPAGGSANVTGLASGCSLIKWGTDLGGRSGKGRTYLPGLPVGSVGTDGRTYTPAHITAMQTAISNYLAAGGWPTGVRPAVISFTKGTASPITSGAPSPIIGLQRRRMR